MTAKQAERQIEGGREEIETECKNRVREMPFLEAWCVSLNVFFTTGSERHIIQDGDNKHLVVWQQQIRV